MQIKLIIPGEPAGKGRPRFTRTGRTFTPEATANYETLVKWAWQSAGEQPFPADVPLRMTCYAYMKQPQSGSRIKHEQMNKGKIRPLKKPDWDNIGKIVCDALNGLAFHDDAQIVDGRVIKYFAPVWEQPRCEVVIEEVVL